MAANDQKRSITYLLITAGLIILVLIAFPFLEEYITLWFAQNFNLTVSPDGVITAAQGEPQGKMSETILNLIITILHIVKIILLMALVITFIRFISTLITRTIYRNATQGEISSLLKTVLTIIV